MVQKNGTEGDEGRYLTYATNLIHGFYSPKDQVYIWNGPGYPILLMPFIALKSPLLLIKCCNALFQYLSIVFLFKTMIGFVSYRKALYTCLFWGCYYIAFREMSMIYTESFTVFLISIFQYAFIKAFHKEIGRKYLITAGLLLGYIILTKVIFSYVVLVLLIATSAMYFFKRNYDIGKTIAIMAIAILTTVPYLIYTYQLTGKLFYYANSGGSSLYWASSPFPGEYGDWNNDDFTTYCGFDSIVPCNAASFAKNHEPDFQIFRKYTGIEKDQLFKEKAIQNIRHYPFKYVRNYICNAGRMLFGVPQSYFYQRFQNLMRIPPNAIVFTCLLFNYFVSFIRFRKMRFEIVLLVLFSQIYFFGSALLSAEQRQFYVIVPVILLWTAYLLQNFFVIRLNEFTGNKNE